MQGEVGLAVGGVGEPVQARTGTRVRHVRLDPQLVGFLQAGQRQPVPGQRGRIQLPAVENHPAQPGRAELDEAPGARYAAAEPDHGRRATTATPLPPFPEFVKLANDFGQDIAEHHQDLRLTPR